MVRPIGIECGTTAEWIYNEQSNNKRQGEMISVRWHRTIKRNGANDRAAYASMSTRTKPTDDIGDDCFHMKNVRERDVADDDTNTGQCNNIEFARSSARRCCMPLFTATNDSMFQFGIAWISDCRSVA